MPLYKMVCIPKDSCLILSERKISISAYKKTNSGFGEWTEAYHAENWLIFPENIGPYLCIDETCLSTGEVYTIVSNKDAHGKKGCIVAIVKGTKAQVVIKALKRIADALRAQVKEVTLDFSDSMHSVVETCFPHAMITLDRFHHQQFCLEAVQEVRIAFRREEMTRVANEREEFRLMLKAYADKGETPTDKDGNPIRLNAAYHPERLERAFRNGIRKLVNMATMRSMTLRPPCMTERTKS